MWIGGIRGQLWAGLLSPLVPQRLAAFVVKEDGGELLAMNELVGAGRATPVLGATFPGGQR